MDDGWICGRSFIFILNPPPAQSSDGPFTVISCTTLLGRSELGTLGVLVSSTGAGGAPPLDRRALLCLVAEPHNDVSSVVFAHLELRRTRSPFSTQGAALAQITNYKLGGWGGKGGWGGASSAPLLSPSAIHSYHDR